MKVPQHPARRGEGRLWTIAFLLSLLGNAGILLFYGFASIRPEIFHRPPAEPPTLPSETETVLRILPETTAGRPAAVESSTPRFARTDESQRGPRPERRTFIGERDTQATSDRAPDPNAPPLPSQAGIEPRHETDIETTESRYQDGELKEKGTAMSEEASPPPSPASDSESVMPPATPTPPSSAADVSSAAAASPPPAEKLMEGPNPVDVPVPPPVRDAAPPAAAAPPAPARAEPQEAPRPTPSKAAATPDPAFKGYQRKTAMQGSISRTGRSSLDVTDTPLGRYQATISRAVEKEWQRNCVRHRDFITPGYLTVRFFVTPAGKVRSVQFLGEMTTGEVQKGFTLNSIRDAEIPAMPPALRKEYQDESLEIIFNFYF